MRRWKAHRGKVAALSFSRDGRFLASVTGSGKDVFIWDATAGELVKKLTPGVQEKPEPLRVNASSIAFAPDADLLAIGRKHWIEVWNVTDWTLSADHRPGDEFGTPYELVVSPGPEPIIVSGHTDRLNRWKWWFAGSSFKSHYSWTLNHNAQLAFSPDGKDLATHTIQELEVWSANGNNWKPSLFRADTGDRAERVGPLRNLEHPPGNYTGPVRYSPDGSRIAFASTKTIESHPASLDDPNDVIRYVGHRNKVWVLRYTPDGRSLISASSDGTARVWDADTGAQKRCFEFDVGKMLAADVSPDGTIAAVGGATGEIIVWDLDD